MLDQGNNFYLLRLSFLITCLMDNVCITYREKLLVNHFCEFTGLLGMSLITFFL